jgi:hypothetical protein
MTAKVVATRVARVVGRMAGSVLVVLPARRKVMAMVSGTCLSFFA